MRDPAKPSRRVYVKLPEDPAAWTDERLEAIAEEMLDALLAESEDDDD